MNNLTVFENPEFGAIRTVELDGEPWLVGKDVADALGYTNPRKALADHVDDEDKGVTKCYTPGGDQDMTIINESGLYSLVLSSKLPTARKFRRWVTSFRDTAKQLGVSQNAFIGFLKERKYIYRDQKGKLMPYAEKNNGLFEVKECFNNKTEWSGVQTMVTPKGRETFRLLLEGCKKEA